MTFKVGDKVKCISTDGDYNITVGKIYTVDAVGNTCIYIIDDVLDKKRCYQRNFELVEDKLPHELLGLPKYFVVKRDESDSLWEKYCDWCDRQDNDWSKTNEDSWYDGGNGYNYVGYDGGKIMGGYDGNDNIDDFDNNPTLITLEERDRCVNKKSSQTKQLSKPIRSCEYGGSIYKEDTIDGVSIEDMKSTRDNINSKLLTHRNLFNKSKK